MQRTAMQRSPRCSVARCGVAGTPPGALVGAHVGMGVWGCIGEASEVKRGEEMRARR